VEASKCLDSRRLVVAGCLPALLVGHTLAKFGFAENDTGLNWLDRAVAMILGRGKERKCHN
jgi:hypothetical protein